MSRIKAAALPVVGAAIFVTNLASADISDLLDNFSPLEWDSAVAVMHTYNNLISHAGCNDALLVDPGSTQTCSGQTYKLFDNVRRLMHTANEISNDPSGGRAFSLGVDLHGLSSALRWNAAEEYNAQASLTAIFCKRN